MAELIKLEDTNFIGRPNWTGTARPEKGQRFFQRSGGIMVNNQDALDKLTAMGFRVYETTPRPGEEAGFIPKYYIYAEMNFKGEGNCQYDPTIYLMSNGRKTKLDKFTVGQLDDIPVSKVNVMINLKISDKGIRHAYVHVMYCWQALDDDPVYRANVYDPWADKY